MIERIFLLFILNLIVCSLNSQRAWHQKYDQNAEWISLVDQYFGNDFEYIGTRNIEGPLQVLFLDRQSIQQKGSFYESKFYQIIFNNSEYVDEFEGVVLDILCDCELLRMKITYLSSFDNSVYGIQNDPWVIGTGNGFGGRVVASICNKRRKNLDYINMTKGNGVYYIPISFNNSITRSFIIDSGASDLYVSKELGDLLFEMGEISERDFLKTKFYEDASGNVFKNKVYNIKEIQIGKTLIKNVECAISEKSNVSLLLGQSLLEKVGKYEIDYLRNQLILK